MNFFINFYLLVNYLASIHYTGHGEKNTGNWCFKDGVITFQDMFGLYMDCFRGKRLLLHSDCSYSGNWIKDCVKTLDDRGIPSCGHHAREQGIFFNMWCSCGANEESTALCYINEAFTYDEVDKRLVIHGNVQLSSGQNTAMGDFRSIRCSKNAKETCEIDSTCTWEDRMFNKSHRVFLVRSKDRGFAIWQYVLVDLDKVDAFIIQFNTGRGNVSDYGTVLYSGRGQNPPKDSVHKVNLRFMPYIDPEI